MVSYLTDFYCNFLFCYSSFFCFITFIIFNSLLCYTLHFFCSLCFFLPIGFFFLQSVLHITTKVSRRSTISLTQEDLMEDHISSNQPSPVGLLHSGKLQLSWRAYPGASNVELPMPKHLAPQPHTNILHCLPLGLVNCDCARRPDWELPSLPLEGVFSRLGDEGDPGN